MTVESIREFLERFRAKNFEPTQTAEQIAQVLRLWHPPHNFIVDDQNLFDLFERCLYSHHGYMDPMWLDTTCRESREYLRWHQAPTPAPAPEPEPAPPEPKTVGKDSLGEAGTVESGLPHHRNSPDEPSHALEDASNYCYSTQDGGSNYRNKLERARQECRNQATTNGVVNHAEANRLLKQRKEEIDKEFAPKNTMSQKDIDAQVEALVEQMKREARPEQRRERVQTERR